MPSIVITSESDETEIERRIMYEKTTTPSELWRSIVLSLTTIEREKRNSLVPVIFQIIGEHFYQEWKRIVLHEHEHIQLVNFILKQLHINRDHDSTKDNYYVFVLAGKFGKLKVSDPEVDEEFQREVSRHYLLEAHHPEHEALNGVDCSDVDILEMAVDRMARNVVANCGFIDMGTMSKYRPSFGQSAERKLSLYDSHVIKYQDIVVQSYHTIMDRFHQFGEMLSLKPTQHPLKILMEECITFVNV